MKMHPTDVWVYENDGRELRVVANMMCFSMDWPDRLFYIGKTFKFQCNEVMKDWMIGEYSGHAKYVEIPSE